MQLPASHYEFLRNKDCFDFIIGKIQPFKQLYSRNLSNGFTDLGAPFAFNYK